MAKVSKRYKIIFSIRFFGYLLIIGGLISFTFMLGPLGVAEVKYRTDKVLGVKRTVANVVPTPVPSNNEATPNTKINDQAEKEALKNKQSFSSNQIVPVSTEFGIVIEKINANARVIPAVNPGNEKEYSLALQEGVAEALGSTPPGQPGNLYIFSHSTDAPWNIVRYNAIFYLLRELEKGDRIVIFYANKRFDYVVFEKLVASPTDVSYLKNRYDIPVLTLQTCDPPGTLLNRLIVRARLVSS
ncbi:hypothetical protein A3C59_02015 [Candidatus Daviesbacteria bacterium RIFCSPHIGHO2_02_FULL_36_13]|uniref:Sortase n=1 Tax=Candidatus Daviesbacteria bacterium RIFCSPHIGHO2_02_FULL_36_13 TaxID=1797768 RepID=A0A1F5JWW5_9BACT|nr:MAG: hypothetical protein A3C59_02015 [Candidatus Daviesbacteria bacterium RIFCSPHIGHO2_02_FULL_36_13]OGE44527.1 MAG: hypothetical protein A3A45_03475 [Candidatus Daviesbacteria bacterium RIFCSPLOWO2_01_FULL_36_8]